MNIDFSVLRCANDWCVQKSLIDTFLDFNFEFEYVFIFLWILFMRWYERF